MNIAKNQNGEIYYISQFLTSGPPKNQQWFCLKCQQPMHLKLSRNNNYFFSHVTACGQGLVKKEAVETEAHQLAKAQLVKCLSPAAQFVESEYGLNDIQQTADIYWQLSNSRQIVLEFQHSPISRKTLLKRHKLYLTQVNQCIWIMNDGQFKSNKLDFWHFSMLQFNHTFGNYWVSLDLGKNLIVIRPNIPLLYQEGFVMEERFYPLDANLAYILLGDVEHLNYRSRKRMTKKVKTKTFNQQLSAIMRNRHYFVPLQTLYRNGFRLHELPKWVLEESWTSPLIVQPMWEFFAWLFVNLKQYSFSSISESAFKELIQMKKPQATFHICQLPLIDEENQQVFFEELIALLIQKDILLQNEDRSFKILIK
ncbi:competence protein CoiA family protein [Fundicoccus culcitae]|uniref:Competence protein CoiA family protein n=1 Tax=Fundicoccus culcitae TaxID=2969821 RepID=A0ABY5P700_9LACT|nr:competence protein CoiA family protein [Fundicoccus culcitae]UUX34155.1 competence protein CoiA family protein [Fundicoccus culcitae]